MHSRIEVLNSENMKDVGADLYFVINCSLMILFLCMTPISSGGFRVCCYCIKRVIRNVLDDRVQLSASSIGQCWVSTSTAL